jgi:carboxylate-amine ligase
MGTGAERQLAVFEKTNDFRAVVDHIVEETKIGLGEPNHIKVPSH